MFKLYQSTVTNGLGFTKYPIQSKDTFTAYWLQNAHVKMMIFHKYTAFFQEHTLIKKSKLEVEVIIIIYENYPDKRFKKKVLHGGRSKYRK